MVSTFECYTYFNDKNKILLANPIASIGLAINHIFLTILAVNELSLYSKNFHSSISNYGLDFYKQILVSLLAHIKMDEDTKNTIIKFLLTEKTMLERKI